jgi:DNA primase
LTQGKRTVAFIDGDRAGDLILKELQGLVDIDKVYRAPSGREVEECTPLEISEILKDVEQLMKDRINDTNTVPSNVQQIRNTHRVDHSQNQLNNQDQNNAFPYSRDFTNQSFNTHNNYDSSKQMQIPDSTVSKEDEEVISTVKKVFQELNETLEAMGFDKSMKKIVKMPISEIMKKISSIKDVNLLILDGIVTPRLVDAAARSGIKYVIGHRTSNLKKVSPDVRVQTFSDMGLISQPISSR